MRYEHLKDIIDLAVRLQGSRAGVTLEDIQQDLSVRCLTPTIAGLR